MAHTAGQSSAFYIKQSAMDQPSSHRTARAFKADDRQPTLPQTWRSPAEAEARLATRSLSPWPTSRLIALPAPNLVPQSTPRQIQANPPSLPNSLQYSGVRRAASYRFDRMRQDLVKSLQLVEMEMIEMEMADVEVNKVMEMEKLGKGKAFGCLRLPAAA